MPATKFICPNGQEVEIPQCLKSCPHHSRCMFIPTLRAIAESLNRKLDKPTVTELIAGTRETYLKKTTDYAVNPMDSVFALHGTAIHALQQNLTDGNILSEERIHSAITSGKFDLYGQILDDDTAVLGDYKVTSSYKLMKAMGFYKKDIPTGEVYKTGARKGQPKTRKQIFTDGVRDVMDWAIQLNVYRMLLEEAGFNVSRMEIQAFCRDYSLQIAASRGITKPIYLIRINRISNHWLKLWLKIKTERLQKALDTHILPKACSHHECWGGRKCTGYCPVADSCPYGRALKADADKAIV